MGLWRWPELTDFIQNVNIVPPPLSLSMALTLFQADNSFLKTLSVSPLLHTLILQTIIINVCHRQQGKAEAGSQGPGFKP